MSLYNHVADKDDLLDGMVDLVVGEIELPEVEADWRQSMLLRAKSAMKAFRHHPGAGFCRQSLTITSAASQPRRATGDACGPGKSVFPSDKDKL